jgi:hypothetical protein
MAKSSNFKSSKSHMVSKKERKERRKEKRQHRQNRQNRKNSKNEYNLQREEVDVSPGLRTKNAFDPKRPPLSDVVLPDSYTNAALARVIQNVIQSVETFDVSQSMDQNIELSVRILYNSLQSCPNYQISHVLAILKYIKDIKKQRDRRGNVPSFGRHRARAPIDTQAIQSSFVRTFREKVLHTRPTIHEEPVQAPVPPPLPTKEQLTYSPPCMVQVAAPISKKDLQTPEEEVVEEDSSWACAIM